MGLFKSAASAIREKGVVQLSRETLSDPYKIYRNSNAVKTLAEKYCQHQDTITVNGVELDTNFKPVQKQAYELFAGRHEDEITGYVDEYISADTNVVELGAGIGYVSSITAQQLAAESTHIVVEPSPHSLSVLKRTKELNDGDYLIEPVAYHPRKNATDLAIDERFILTSTVRDKDKSMTVECINLESLIGKYTLDEFALIVDIEGAEIQLIESELDLIRQHCPLLIIEYHKFGGFEEDVVEIEKELDEEFSRLRTKGEAAEKVVYKNPVFQ